MLCSMLLLCTLLLYMIRCGTNLLFMYESKCGVVLVAKGCVMKKLKVLKGVG